MANIAFDDAFTDYIDQLLRTGLFGNTRDKVVMELIKAQLRQCARDGLVVIRRPPAEQGEKT